MSAKTASKAEEVKEVVAEKKTPAPVKKQENLTYLGPTITGVIRHSTVFLDGILPAKAQKCVSETPMMKKLFVTADQMVDAVKELRKESALSSIYEQVSQKYSRR